MRRAAADGAGWLLRDEAVVCRAAGARPGPRPGAGRCHPPGGDAHRLSRDAAGYPAVHDRGDHAVQETEIRPDRAVLRHARGGHAVPGAVAYGLMRTPRPQTAINSPGACGEAPRPGNGRRQPRAASKATRPSSPAFCLFAFLLKAPLIAKIDRLARNVHFISGLMEAKVVFLAADLPSVAPCCRFPGSSRSAVYFLRGSS